jgi:hypothetical protein
MSRFIPEDEEDFPQIHTILDEIILESTDENIFGLSSEFLPTNYEVLENWIHHNQSGYDTSQFLSLFFHLFSRFTIRDLPITIQHIDTLINAVERFSVKCKQLFDGFLNVCTKVSSFIFLLFI